MQLASLRGIQFEKDIRSELSRIPRDLGMLYEDLYQNALESAKDTARALMQNALKWMLCSQAILPQKDFFQAITAFLDVDVDDFDEDVILDLLNNFVVSYTTESGVQSFRFAHLSVREFLETKPEYCVSSSNSFAAEVSLLTLIGCSGSPSASRFVQELGLDASTFIPFSEVESHTKVIHDYCIRFWAEHCELAGGANRTADSKHLNRLLHYFLFDDSDENCPVSRWWRSYHRLLGISRHAFAMKNFFYDHEQSADRALFLASCYGFDEIVSMERPEVLSAHLQTECSMAAAIHQQHSVLRSLLDTTNNRGLLQELVFQMVVLRDVDGVREFLKLLEPAEVTKLMLARARRPEIISMLLDHNRGIQITTKMVEENGWASDCINVYLDRAPDLEITSGILSNAIGNMGFDSFKRLVDRADPAIITSNVIAVAVFKAHVGPHVLPIMELLLERAGEIEVNDVAMIQAVVNSKSPEMVKRLIDQGWILAPRIIEYGARTATKEAFQVLFGASGANVTPRLLELAAANDREGDRVVTLLVNLLDDAVDDETWNRMLVRCARNRSRGQETMGVLLPLKPTTKVGEKVFLVALEMDSDDHRTLNRMLNRMLDENRELEITDSVVRCALEKMKYDETITKILDRHGCPVISCDMMIGAVSNSLFGDEMTKLLLHREGMLEPPSAEVRNAVICNDLSGYEILQMLESRFGNFTFTDADLESAASGSLKMLKLILNRRGISHTPGSLIQEAASCAHLDVLKHVLQLYDGPFGRDMVVAAAGNGGSGAEKFKLIWDLAPDVKPCPELFLEAAKAGEDNLNLILDRLEDESLCQTVLDATVQSRDDCYDLVRTFLRRGAPVKISQKTFMDAIESGNGEILGLVLNHMPEFEITQEIVDLAVEREDYGCLLILDREASPTELNLQGVREGVSRLFRTAWVRDFDKDI